jgi:hypothetical protein
LDVGEASIPAYRTALRYTINVDEAGVPFITIDQEPL